METAEIWTSSNQSKRQRLFHDTPMSPTVPCHTIPMVEWVLWMLKVCPFGFDPEVEWVYLKDVVCLSVCHSVLLKGQPEIS